MKKLTLLIVALYLGFYKLNAQTALPYFTGFDNATQQAGWADHRESGTDQEKWKHPAFGPYSAPGSLVHLYPLSNDITIDWYVSSPFDFSAGGKIDSLRFAFHGFDPMIQEYPTINDTIAVFLISGSANPMTATTKILLADFRNADYVPDAIFRKKANIIIPAVPGVSYIAFKYRVGGNHLSCWFDNLALSANTTTSFFTEKSEKANLSVFPNPVSDNFIINYSGNEPTPYKLFDNLGREVGSGLLTKGNQALNLEKEPKGIYTLKAGEGTSTNSYKIIKE